ncbi:MAG: hypothetical protein ACPGQS_11360, partial [Bradymonadia bacterium]
MTTQFALRLITLGAMLTLFACSSDPAVVGGDPDTPDMQVDNPNEDCTNFVIQEGTAPINCEEVDKCDPEQISQRVICSYCDPVYN